MGQIPLQVNASDAAFYGKLAITKKISALESCPVLRPYSNAANSMPALIPNFLAFATYFNDALDREGLDYEHREALAGAALNAIENVAQSTDIWRFDSTTHQQVAGIWDNFARKIEPEMRMALARHVISLEIRILQETARSFLPEAGTGLSSAANFEPT